MTKSQYEIDSCVGICLVTLYAKCKNPEDECGVFTRLDKLDLVSWLQDMLKIVMTRSQLSYFVNCKVYGKAKSFYLCKCLTNMC